MGTSPLFFTAPALADAPRVRELTQNSLGSDAAFANIYLLQEKYETTIAIADDCLFRHYGGHGRLMGYAFPCGSGDAAAALDLLHRDATARERSFRFCLLTHEQKNILEQIYPGAFTFTTDRGDADYLYTRQQLAELPGSGFHAKRNHIAQFERTHSNWHLAPLSCRKTVGDALLVAQGWLQSVADDSPALQHESRAIEHALQHLDELGLFGAVLYVADKPVAMSIGSHISPSTADIHYEKCLPEWKKAYPLINREIARLLKDSHYINREEDLNQPGLRQAKLSYHPALVLEKFSAIPHSAC